MAATTREYLLVSMAMYAGDMNRADAIDLPFGIAGEDELADFCVECVDNFMERDNDVGHDEHGMDIPFDEYAEVCLLRKFGWRDETNPLDYLDDDEEIVTTPVTHCVIATAGRVEKTLFEGSHEECERFCDTWN